MLEKGFRVLIVEDKKPTRERITRILVSAGYTVDKEITDTYARGLEKVQKFKPHVVIVDIELTDGLTGLDLAEEIDSTYSIPVVILTNMGDEKLYRRGLQIGPVNYLYKPLNERQVLAEMAKALLPETIIIEVGTTWPLIPLKVRDILVVKANGHFTFIYTKNNKGGKEKHHCSKSFGEIYNILPRDLFIRTHKSYLVNIRSYCGRIGSKKLMIDFGIEKLEVSIGRTFRNDVLSKLRIP